MLDFNKAYSPPCAFTSFATCPLPAAAEPPRRAYRGRREEARRATELAPGLQHLLPRRCGCPASILICAPRPCSPPAWVGATEPAATTTTTTSLTTTTTHHARPGGAAPTGPVRPPPDGRNARPRHERHRSARFAGGRGSPRRPLRRGPRLTGRRTRPHFHPATASCASRSCSTARTSRRARSTAATARTRGCALAAFAKARGASGAERPGRPGCQTPRPRSSPYTIAPEDVAGPFTRVPDGHDGEGQAARARLRLRARGAGREVPLQARPAQAAQSRARRSRAGEQIQVPNVTRTPAGKAAKVVVDKSDMSVSALDAQGRVLGRYPATMGSEHDPLPLGTWKITGVSATRRSPTIRTSSGTRRASTPRRRSRPARTTRWAWSGSTCRRSTTASTARRSPSTIGKTESHGCIRVTNWDALELADMVKPGTPPSCRSERAREDERRVPGRPRARRGRGLAGGHARPPDPSRWRPRTADVRGAGASGRPSVPAPATAPAAVPGGRRSRCAPPSGPDARD